MERKRLTKLPLHKLAKDIIDLAEIAVETCDGHGEPVYEDKERAVLLGALLRRTRTTPEQHAIYQEAQVNRELRIVERATGDVVRRVAITGDKSESQVQKVLSGMLRNMDTDRFHVEDSANDKHAKKTVKAAKSKPAKKSPPVAPIPETQRTRFIAALAEYLVADQAEQSIRLQMGQASAKLWARLRGATPLFGYPTVGEAGALLTKWFDEGMR